MYKEYNIHSLFIIWLKENNNNKLKYYAHTAMTLSRSRIYKRLCTTR